MQPKQLSAVVAFTRVAHHGSFTRAAAELEVSPSALSQTVRGLEAQLGMRLLNRTTRKVGLTEHGAQFLAQVRPALEMIGGAFDSLDDARQRPNGTLRINLARVTASIVVMPGLDEFRRRYPDLSLDLAIHDGFVDLIAGGFDAGIRLGESLAQDMVAVPVSGPMRMCVVGSPDYFRRRGRPQTPGQLAGHECIRYRFVGSGVIAPWEFERDGQSLKIEPKGHLLVNDGEVLIDAARQGLGLAYIFEAAVEDELRSGKLQRVLGDWCEPFPGFFLYYPSRAQMPLKLRVFIDFLQQRMRERR